WPVASFENGVYHLRVYGPNGFYREFRGTAGDPPILALPEYLPQGPAIRLAVANRQSSGDLACSVEDVSYGKPAVARAIPAGGHSLLPLDLTDSSGWYDFTLRIAGHDS